MEELELEFNDYVTYIFVLVKREGKYQYYFSDKEHWFMDNWQYVERLENVSFIETALKKVERYKIPLETIKNEYLRLKEKGHDKAIINNSPMLYINFDKMILKSRYYEQSLHTKILDGWTGTYEQIIESIPNELIYWKL